MSIFTRIGKTPRIATAALLAVFATGIGAEIAAAAEINCPLRQIRREVVTPLPSGWWYTPIINSLTDTRIITFGDGSKALQCIYGPAGTIMRKPPRGQTCTARRGGFTCRGGSGSTVRLVFSGRQRIKQTYAVDFDRNSRNSRDSDLWFEAEDRDLYYLVPQNGAMISVGNRSNRGHAGCARARFTRNRVSLRDVPAGSYVCYRTNEGRIGQFRMNGITRGVPKYIDLSYTTWR